MSLESVRRIADLTGRARETVKKLLEPLTPVKSGKALLYETRDALPLVYEINTGGSENFDLTKERARLDFHRANIEGLKEAKLRGDLIPASDVLEEWQRMLSDVRSKLLALPNRAAVLMPGIETYREAEQILKKFIYEALTELSQDGLPDGYQKEQMENEAKKT